jgi:hypothetical protein
MGQVESSEARPRLQLGAIAILVVSLAFAGVGAGYAFDATRGYLDPEVKSGSASEDQIRQGMELRQSISRKGSSLGGAAGGAIIVGVFGLIIGSLAGSTTRAGIGFLAGAALGATFGAIGGYITQELSEYAISNSLASMTTYFLISAAYWLSLGLAAALTSALAGSIRTPTGGRMVTPILGGVLAAVLTPVLATVVYPVDFKGRIPPQETAECYFVGAVGAAFLALGTGIGFKKTDHL